MPSSETLGVPAWSWTGGASGVHPGEAGGRSPGMIDVILALCLSLMTLPPPPGSLSETASRRRDTCSTGTDQMRSAGTRSLTV